MTRLVPDRHTIGTGVGFIGVDELCGPRTEPPPTGLGDGLGRAGELLDDGAAEGGQVRG